MPVAGVHVHTWDLVRLRHAWAVTTVTDEDDRGVAGGRGQATPAEKDTATTTALRRAGVAVRSSRPLIGAVVATRPIDGTGQWRVTLVGAAHHGP